MYENKRKNIRFYRIFKFYTKIYENMEIDIRTCTAENIVFVRLRCACFLEEAGMDVDAGHKYRAIFQVPDFLVAWFIMILV